MNCNVPGLPVPQHPPKFAQGHVHCISDTIQPSHPLMPSSPKTALNLSQHQGLFQWAVCLYQMTKILEFQLEHQSFQQIFRVDFPWLLWSPCCPEDFQESSPASQSEGISSLALCLLYSPALTIIRDCWEDHSLDHVDLCWQGNVSGFQYTA